jgi:hypothetical protein
LEFDDKDNMEDDEHISDDDDSVEDVEQERFISEDEL